MNKYEYEFYLKEIENKLQEFIMLELEAEDTSTAVNECQTQEGY